MTDCCKPDHAVRSKNLKFICPQNGQEYIEVPLKTVLHHISQPWLHDLVEQRYYFCTDVNCDVVYFAEDETIIRKSELRHKIGSKEKSNDVDICYCFGVTRQAALDDVKLKEYVIQMTKNATCSCEILNPAGRCCLKDFPK